MKADSFFKPILLFFFLQNEVLRYTQIVPARGNLSEISSRICSTKYKYAIYHCLSPDGLDLSVSSSSWGLGRAAVCDCGTPWTFLLPFINQQGAKT